MDLKRFHPRPNGPFSRNASTHGRSPRPATRRLGSLKGALSSSPPPKNCRPNYQSPTGMRRRTQRPRTGPFPPRMLRGAPPDKPNQVLPHKPNQVLHHQSNLSLRNRCRATHQVGNHPQVILPAGLLTLAQEYPRGRRHQIPIMVTGTRRNQQHPEFNLRQVVRIGHERNENGTDANL